MRQKVVIIGHGYTSRLGIIRSLAGMDCEITVVAMVFHRFWGRAVRLELGKPIDCYSKYVHRVLYSLVNDGQGLVRLLLEKCSDPEQKVILIPDSDFSAAVLDNNRDVLSRHFVFPGIGNEAGKIEYWMNKNVQKALAEQVGIPVSKGCIVDVQDHGYELPSGLKYPCFTKALATISGGKQFLKRCDDEARLRAVLDKVASRYNTKVLIEDYKEIDKEYAVVGFSDGKETVIPGIIEFTANSMSHFGIAREGRIMPVDGFEAIIGQFKEFVGRIGFSGLFDIDFYRSGGILYFSEINLRFGGSGYAATAMGVNLPGMMVRAMSGRSFADSNRLIERTATFVNERMCLDDYLFGYIDKQKYTSILESGEIHFIFDGADPGPGRRFRRYYYAQQINKCRRSLQKMFR